MVFQPNTSGYLITTVETVLLTGKRNAPIWLAILTGLALLAVLAGGVILFLLLTAKTGHRSDVLDDYLGVAALLATFLFPIAAVIRAYLRLDNPIAIPRSSIVAVQRHGPTIVLQATGHCYPITFLPLHPAAVNLSKPDANAAPLPVDTPEDTTQ
jgi:hypothetical protein